MLLTRLDDLLVDLDPSAIMVHGGGMTAVVAAQVAFWRQIPVVHLQAGVATDDLLCPFPQEANRRVIGQLASLFLTTGGAALGSPIGPNSIPVGDTMAANPQPSDLRFAGLVRRVRTRGTRLVMVGLDRPDSLGVLASLPELLDREPDIELVAFGRLAAHGAAHSLALHERAVVVRNVPASELLGLITASTVLVSDDPELVADAPGLGTPAVLVDGPHIPQPGDSIRSILSPASWTPSGRCSPPRRVRPRRCRTGWRRVRVEQAVAWMFGLTPSPQLDCRKARRTTGDSPGARGRSPVLLSDVDLRKELEAGRLVLDPWDPAMLQPSSVDVRLDRFFRVFQNSRYTHIDPMLQQDELTTEVEPDGDDPFVLHPGEFVLGSTFETVGLPDDLAGRLEGKALAIGTPVPTIAGWRTMGSLRVGDLVFGVDGHPTPVVAATKIMSGRPCSRSVLLRWPDDHR